jgi:hypothetical protein
LKFPENLIYQKKLKRRDFKERGEFGTIYQMICFMINIYQVPPYFSDACMSKSKREGFFSGGFLLRSENFLLVFFFFFFGLGTSTMFTVFLTIRFSASALSTASCSRRRRE